MIRRMVSLCFAIGTLANLVMSHHEGKWLNNLEGCDIVMYRRYVDDIYCVNNNCETDVIKFREQAVFQRLISK